MNKVYTSISIAYVLGFILTFGHAFNEIDKNYISSNGSNLRAEANTAGALMCGLAFPLYWSVQAFK